MNGLYGLLQHQPRISFIVDWQGWFCFRRTATGHHISDDDPMTTRMKEVVPKPTLIVLDDNLLDMSMLSR